MGPGTMSARVGANVRRYRTERGITQERLTELLAEAGVEMSDAALSRLETGRRAVTVDHLAAFADVLDCAPSDLLELPEERPTTLTLVPRSGAVAEPVQHLTPELMRMLAGLAVVTPETQGTLDRIAAASSASLRATLAEHALPLMAAITEAGRSAWVPREDASE